MSLERFKEIIEDFLKNSLEDGIYDHLPVLGGSGYVYRNLDNTVEIICSDSECLWFYQKENIKGIGDNLREAVIDWVLKNIEEEEKDSQ